MTSERLTARRKALILKAVAEKRRGLTPAAIVEEANPGNKEGCAHALSALVGWNKPDDQAALLWRADQARAIIRSVEPELVQLGVLTIEAPFYVHNPASRSQGYVSLLAIKSKNEVAEEALSAEFDRAAAALNRAYKVALTLEQEDAAASALAALGAIGRAPAALAGQAVGLQPSVGG